MGSYNKTNEMY